MVLFTLIALGLLGACAQQQPPIAPEKEREAEAYLPVNTELAVQPYLTTLSTDTTVRINAGGNAVTTADGRTWSADIYFNGGNAYTNPNVQDIANTADDVLFRTERSARTDLGTFAYNIPVPQDGTYAVVLHFAEIYFGAPGGSPGGSGRRVFNVDINAARYLTNFDIFAEVGALTATSRTYNVNALGGVVSLDFSASVNRPKISAIEVTLTDAIDEPPPPPDPDPEPTDAIRINAGGATTTTSGVTWLADSYFTGGAAFANFNISDIANTADDILYLTERSASTDLGSFSYAIPVAAPGRYQVRLHFAEIWWGAPGGGSGGTTGQRVFDVDVEGVRLLSNYDIVAEVGTMSATIKAFAVDVEDGVLDLAFSPSANRPKVSAIEVLVAGELDRPAVTSSSPGDGTQDVYRDVTVTSTLYLPNFGAGVDATTLSTTTVQLYRTSDGAMVPGTVNTSGARDSLVYQPHDLLGGSTTYTFKVTEGVKDESGAAFLPYEITFTTGTSLGVATDPRVRFTKTTVYEGGPLSSLTVGPDGKLYAAGLDGVLRRWQIDGNGRLQAEQTFRGLEGRVVIGIAFDPNDDKLMYLWSSHNDPLTPIPAQDFTGKISKLRLRGLNFFDADLQDYIVGLPRSARDHLSNKLTFGPDGTLYMSQGSNTGFGAPDSVWYDRPERLLTAAILQIDTTVTSNLPINVQTEPYDGRPGNYDPYAPGAPVKIFATGLRNAFDLVWHSNGFLYVPTNGGNAGGRTPASPDGSVPGLNNVYTQPDFLYRVEQGGYYGHPNPLRGEYVLNGGNPTGSRVLGDEVVAVGVHPGYPVGTQPDPNYRGFAWNFGMNPSANGAIEYRSRAFGGLLTGNILVVQFSAGKNILALAPDASFGGISRVIEVMSGFNDPLDLAEDPRNGNLYVAELIGWGVAGRIQLLTPDDAVSTNFPPIVNAGEDQSITLPNVAYLHASATDDGLPNLPGSLAFAWAQLIGPGTTIFDNSAALSTTASFTQAGTYILQFTADDGELSTSDQVTIEVLPVAVAEPNLAPVVDAGPDRIITLPTDSVTLIASAQDDGLPNPPGALTFNWSQVSGSGSVAFGNPSSRTTTATFPALGTYVLRFSASDGEYTSADQMTVSVVAADSSFTEIAWSTVATAPSGRTEAQVAVLDGKMYVFGGYSSFTPFCTSTDSFVYDPSLNTWAPVASMPEPWTHAGVAIDGRVIYLAGGYLNEPNCNRTELATTTVWKFDIDAQTWSSPLPPLPLPRASGGLERLGRNLHFFGGTDGNRIETGDHWVLALDGGSEWTAAAPLPNPRSHLGSASFDGSIYAIGGQHGHEGGAIAQTSVHRYDPVADTWSSVASVPVPLSHHSASTFVMGERIITIGGERGDSQQLDHVLAYHPRLDTWTSLTPLPKAVRSGVGGTIGNELFFSGGDFHTTTYRGVPGSGTPPDPTNQAPVVDAGPDQSITLPTNTITLTASASDDGLPNPPGTLTYQWTQVSGPGNRAVTFSDPSALVTTATFPRFGTYVLRFTAGDGEFTSSDDVNVTVSRGSTHPVR